MWASTRKEMGNIVECKVCGRPYVIRCDPKEKSACPYCIAETVKTIEAILAVRKMAEGEKETK